ncbi:MAG: conserved repeat domain, partial [Planctomycetaceae bacterium]|nr:conserved repeat domain [Planctomycetaceae bacterium]
MSRKVPNYWGWQWRGGVGSSGNRRVPQRPNAMLRSSLEVLEARWLLTIGAPTNYNIGSTTDGFIPNAAPVNVVSADFNQDGKIDLVVAHNSDNSVYFLRGNGDGSFQPAVKTSVGQAIIGQERMGDFNNDGKLDVFLPSAASNSPAIVLLGNGDGTFQTPVTSSSFNGPSGSYPRGWALGDFNGDGKLDVVATLPSNTTGDGGYTVLLGNGNGTFQAGIVSGRVLGYSRWVATADFNGDGKLDLATADGQGTSSSIGNVQLSVMLGNGNGTFQAPTHYASPQLADSADANAVANPEDVVIGDVNGDGKLDCIVSDYDNTINVFLGYGNGTFKAAVSKEVEDYPRDVVIADMNHDGKMDLVVGALGIGQGGSEFPIEGYQPGYVGVLIGNGDGTFHDSIDYHPFAYPGWTAVADFNGDSYPDLATTQVFDGHSLAVMLNNPTSPNLPPTVVSGPTASPSVVTGTSVVLSVLGADDGGESKLTYTWDTTVSPPGAVTFNVNGTNAAKNVTVQFSKPGVYYFRVTVKDATGLSTIGMVPVTVYSTLASIAVTPTAVTVAPSGTQQFTATAKDQFGVALSPQPALSWTVNGGGTISSSGLFTASSTASGQFIVSAKSGSISGTANVTVGTSTSSTATWTGLGTSSNWSDAANWSTNKAPVAGTTVIFNATSTKNAILDTGFAGAVASVQINTGYTGTVTLTKSLIVSGSFTEVAGTFSAGSSTLYLGGNITISGGVFNAGTGTVVISGTTANQNLSAAGVNFYNVVDANSSSYSLNV